MSKSSEFGKPKDSSSLSLTSEEAADIEQPSHDDWIWLIAVCAIAAIGLLIHYWN